MEQPQEITIDYSQLLSQSLGFLQEDMAQYPSFDPAAPYDEKNSYINRANNIYRQLFTVGSWTAVNFYQTLLEAIIEYEKRSGKNFNKGIVLANLGIAEIIQGNFDLGVAHLLAAQEGDRRIVPEFDILNGPLWGQFEQPLIYNYLKNLNGDTRVALGFSIDDPWIASFLGGLSQHDRIFFEGTVGKIRLNSAAHQDIPNPYTHGELYSCLRDLCVVSETLLRRKRHLLDPTTISVRLMLWELLQRALSGTEFATNPLPAHQDAIDFEEYLSKLDTIWGSGFLAQTKQVYSLALTRNFTGHHLEISDAVTTLTGKRFFDDYYETVVVNIIAALLSFKHVNLV